MPNGWCLIFNNELGPKQSIQSCYPLSFFKISFLGILTEMSNVSEISLPGDSITRVSCFQRSRTSGRPGNVRSEKIYIYNSALKIWFTFQRIILCTSVAS